MIHLSPVHSSARPRVVPSRASVRLVSLAGSTPVGRRPRFTDHDSNTSPPARLSPRIDARIHRALTVARATHDDAERLAVAMMTTRMRVSAAPTTHRCAVRRGTIRGTRDRCRRRWMLMTNRNRIDSSGAISREEACEGHAIDDRRETVVRRVERARARRRRDA